MVFKELILTISILGGCGEGVVVLKELILKIDNFGWVWLS